MGIKEILQKQDKEAADAVMDTGAKPVSAISKTLLKIR